MAGPTPVSALIHAATMVAAGVYLVGRMYVVFVHADPFVLTIVSVIAAITTLGAAFLALVQDDIKRVLAYSTLSQLAYMVAGLSLGPEGVTAGFFHLFTHAFFKALLFLGAGSVIHAVHSNNMSDMGGLKDEMPVTFWTFLIGSAALAGVFPLAGFWSKDELLVGAWEHKPVALLRAPRRRRDDGLLHDPVRPAHVLRHLSRRRPPARVAAGDDRPAGGPRGRLGRRGVPRRAAARGRVRGLGVLRASA